MKRHGDWVRYCPKCDAFMDGDLASVSYQFLDDLRIGNGTDLPPYQPTEFLEVSCPRCKWSYRMETADAAAEVPA